MKTFKLCQISHNQLLSRFEKLPDITRLVLFANITDVVETRCTMLLDKPGAQAVMQFFEGTKAATENAVKTFEDALYHILRLSSNLLWREDNKASLPDEVVSLNTIFEISSIYRVISDGILECLQGCASSLISQA